MTQRPLIVLAEDTLAIREMTDQALTEEGFDVVCSSAGSQAYELLRRLLPDLVILDLHLFGHDTGLAVLRQMRKNRQTASIPVIIYSADAMRLDDLAADIRRYGGVRLGKPFTLETLVAMVREQLAARRDGSKERIHST